jgi:Mg-chelatase subunit ChlD
MAETISNETKYIPLDMVLVLDTSGSMKGSDPDKLTAAATKMLANMMPAEDSRLAVITFNTKPTVLTKVDGEPEMLELKDIGNVLDVKSSVDKIVYQGDTGIGNALIAATNLLAEQGRDDSQKVILLFTDGLNDFGNDQIALARCEENESEAVLWAKDNDCPIYCFGYDYETATGTSSMGENGEGINKLTNISTTSKGEAVKITDINSIQDAFIKMLADICSLYYVETQTVPGDGNRHEVSMSVSPSVVEANIRISCLTADALKSGTIELYDPDGNKIELKNEGNIRFDVDATAASIKVILPAPGKWLLVLDGIVGDDIKIGLLEHYDLDIASSLELPEGNPSGVAYTNDVIKAKTWLTTDGNQIMEPVIYDTITSAILTYIPRANPENEKTIALTKDVNAFVGEFVIEEECVYDVKIRLESDTFYREDSLTIQSNNHPLETVSNIDDVTVNKNKPVTISDIYQHVKDEEGDDIQATVSMIGEPETASVEVVGNDLKIEGHKWKSTFATVEFTDAQGNKVDTTFKIKVNDPVAMAIIIGVIALIVAGLIAATVIGYKLSLRIKGNVEILELAKTDLITQSYTEVLYRNSTAEYSPETQTFSEPPPEEDDPFAGMFGKSNKSSAPFVDPFADLGVEQDVPFECYMNIIDALYYGKHIHSIAHVFADRFRQAHEWQEDKYLSEIEQIESCVNVSLKDLTDFILVGTPGGIKGFRIILPKKTKAYMQGFKNAKGKIRIEKQQQILEFVIPIETETPEQREAWIFKFKYIY